MCAICAQYEMGKLTKYEVQQALLELVQAQQIDLDHIFEVSDLITKEEESDVEEEGLYEREARE